MSLSGTTVVDDSEAELRDQGSESPLYYRCSWRSHRCRVHCIIARPWSRRRKVESGRGRSVSHEHVVPDLTCKG